MLLRINTSTNNNLRESNNIRCTNESQGDDQMMWSVCKYGVVGVVTETTGVAGTQLLNRAGSKSSDSAPSDPPWCPRCRNVLVTHSYIHIIAHPQIICYIVVLKVLNFDKLI